MLRDICRRVPDRTLLAAADARRLTLWLSRLRLLQTKASARQYTEADGAFSLKMIPGLRYERARYLGINGWSELAGAEKFHIDFSKDSHDGFPCARSSSGVPAGTIGTTFSFRS